MNVPIHVLNALDWADVAELPDGRYARYASRSDVAYRRVLVTDASGKPTDLGDIFTAPLPDGGPLAVDDVEWCPSVVTARYYALLMPLWWTPPAELVRALPLNNKVKAALYCMLSPDRSDTAARVYVTVVDTQLEWERPPSEAASSAAEKAYRANGLGWYEPISNLLNADNTLAVPTRSVGPMIEVPVGTDFGFAEALDTFNGMSPFGPRGLKYG